MHQAKIVGLLNTSSLRAVLHGMLAAIRGGATSMIGIVRHRLPRMSYSSTDYAENCEWLPSAYGNVVAAIDGHCMAEHGRAHCSIGTHLHGSVCFFITLHHVQFRHCKLPELRNE